MIQSVLLTLRTRLADFVEDARGSLSVEAVLVLPLLCWFYVGSFVWFDAYRTQNTNLKASYTLADMLSRQTDAITDGYLNGLNTVYGHLAQTGNPTSLRVTVIKCVDSCVPPEGASEADVAGTLAARELRVDWSFATDGYSKLNSGNLPAYNNRIPFMPESDTVILLETFMEFTPIFDAGLSSGTLENYIVTRPRFAPQLLYAGVGSS